MKICPRCGHQNIDKDNFCTRCGLPISFVQKQPEKKKASVFMILGLVVGFLIVALLTTILVILIQRRSGDTTVQNDHKRTEETAEKEASDDSEEDEETNDFGGISLPVVASLPRRTLFAQTTQLYNQELVPSIPSYSVSADFSNIANQSILSFSDEVKAKIAQNGFVVCGGYSTEFYSLYYTNKYFYMSSFVSVDSIMHVYHLYFSHLQRNIERNYLTSTLSTLSGKMLEKSMAQLDALRGTEWEQAARMNVAYFTVASSLQNPATVISADIIDIVSSELNLIKDGSSISLSPVFGTEVDYSLYQPRGYYEEDLMMEDYFRTLIWYGTSHFVQADENADRSALLMTMALDEETFPLWESIYTISSFFSGCADDFCYYEYKPILDAVYGMDATVASLPGATDQWYLFHALTSQLDPPVISAATSVSASSDENKGYRFMGQRITIDQIVFQNLTYSNVEEQTPEDRRYLPDTLDLAAAMGSEQALSILQSQGSTAYPGYMENLQNLREETMSATEELRCANLYTNWLYTLSPLLETKGDGYPGFMQTDLWAKKELETFAASYTELKHDTLHYAKQWGGKGDPGEEPIVVDDRGYVEPEPELFSRLSVLAEQTAAGLKGFGMLSDTDNANLLRLSILARQLMTISEKELMNQTLSDEEYELIRSIGDELYYYWEETTKEEQENYEIRGSDGFPAALIVDIATGMNGYCLEAATAKPSIIYVACLIDGQVKICSGMVYNWCQFTQPTSERLTDTDWRRLLGLEVLEDGMTYSHDYQLEKPAWTDDYRYYWK